MLNIVLWKWKQRPVFREQYRAEYVNAVARSISANLSTPHRIVCITDVPRDVQVPTHPLWADHAHVTNMSGQHLPSCYRRLKIFDRSTQAEIGIPAGERIVSFDVDAVVVGQLDPLFQRDEEFVGWTLKGGKRSVVLNGSMFMLRAGSDKLQKVWRSFDPRHSPLRAHNAGFLGSDQAHMSYCLVGDAETGGWTRHDGVLSFTRDVLRGGVRPQTGRVVFFAGSRKPWHQELQRDARWIGDYIDYKVGEKNVKAA